MTKALAALDGTDALELRSRVLLDLADVELRIGDPDAISAALDRAEAGVGQGQRRPRAKNRSNATRLGRREAPGLGTPGPRGLI